MPAPSLDTALERLQASGYRLTRPRRAVARALLEARGWLRPEQVLRRARRSCRTVGLVTVYRTLGVLEDLGLARRIHVAPGCHGYAPVGLTHGHYLVCQACHQVVEFPGREDLQPLIRHISRTTGFRVDHHLLELSGRCPACRGAEAGGGEG
jgi:Fe2+ or Zn2+ uptake regulation protein